MDEIGHILREARENKGLTLEEVQANTRIADLLTPQLSGRALRGQAWRERIIK